ncbi:SDR family NAD(P)-dependent oxidoreductase [Candidatus Gottesmanbacteria bacterium]|nr:SDR family NAD(P)-dependent oxidoreductase [Candidatus Gottesmanbacteria bacterium]
MKIKGKVAIVTGASSGIGMACAKLLSHHGAKVALVARSKNILDNLYQELADSYTVATDIRKENQIKEMVKKVYNKFGRIDILVNNAGRGYDAMVEKIDIGMLRELIDLNFIGPLITMQEVIPIMRNQRGGTIINISSGTSLMSIPNIAAYSSLKKALNGLSLTAREELAKDKISVSVVYPYITATNFGKNIMGGVRKWQPQDEDPDLPPVDPPEIVAEKILEVIKTGKPQIYAHDWMGKMR